MQMSSVQCQKTPPPLEPKSTINIHILYQKMLVETEQKNKKQCKELKKKVLVAHYMVNINSNVHLIIHL